jgi:hypothetical protein
MATAGTIASRAYAPKPGAAARPAIVRKACQQLAGGKNTGETLLTQNRKHYLRFLNFDAGGGCLGLRTRSLCPSLYGYLQRMGCVK